MAISSEYSLADIAAATGNDRNNSGMWGGDWSAWIIIFLIFAACGWGNGGFGGAWVACKQHVPRKSHFIKA